MSQPGDGTFLVVMGSEGICEGTHGFGRLRWPQGLGLPQSGEHRGAGNQKANSQFPACLVGGASLWPLARMLHIRASATSEGKMAAATVLVPVEWIKNWEKSGRGELWVSGPEAGAPPGRALMSSRALTHWGRLGVGGRGVPPPPSGRRVWMFG